MKSKEICPSYVLNSVKHVMLEEGGEFYNYLSPCEKNLADIFRKNKPELVVEYVSYSCFEIKTKTGELLFRHYTLQKLLEMALGFYGIEVKK